MAPFVLLAYVITGMGGALIVAFLALCAGTWGLISIWINKSLDSEDKDKK